MSFHPNGSTIMYNKFIELDNGDTLNIGASAHMPCVYGWFIDGVCVYVGQTMNFLYRTCDHLYYTKYPSKNNGNRTLYNILNYALYQCNSDVFVASLVTIEDDNPGYYQCKKWLDAYESQIISTKLPILNKMLPWVDGVEDRKQNFIVKKDQIPMLFSPKFTEHRELLDYDYRKMNSYIYNEHYDNILINKGYSFGFNIKTNKIIKRVLSNMEDDEI